jgi:peptidoglycan hydrolase CwlO-like protein
MKTIHLSPVVERIIVIVAIALVGVSFFGYLVTEQRGWNNYSTSYQETISSNASSTQSLLSVIDELKVDLDVAQKTIEDNEDEIDRLDGKVDDLTTIVKTDPELLQKYSKVFFLSENYKPTSIKEVDAELVFPKKKLFSFTVK